MKKQNPKDVKVTDALRDWSVAKGWPMFLPDQFITDFHDRSEASGKTYANAEMAFKNQIRWSSPGQRFYSAQEWENKVRAAKAMERTPKRTSTPTDYVAGIPVNPGRQAVNASEIARAALAAARQSILKG
ncbi:hypothetical protein UFOVP1165_21 [uncultured Caudovirales phage]|uniref:Uncharacterized protein n=1 Tax=uncultured Caudovirales phage TaxID=2100421 RepID=A0A6J5R3I1_9CAUD|nr:hypothetical protein UFOVP1165_21 [uncultured Caudovirales phage]